MNDECSVTNLWSWDQNRRKSFAAAYEFAGNAGLDDEGTIRLAKTFVALIADAAAQRGAFRVAHAAQLTAEAALKAAQTPPAASATLAESADEV